MKRESGKRAPRLTGPAADAALLSEGGIMSGVMVWGGSRPLVTFCWIRYMARENCSLDSLPTCWVSARLLGTTGTICRHFSSTGWHSCQKAEYEPK